LGRVAIAALVVCGVSCHGDSAEPSLSSSLRVAVADIAGIDSLLPSERDAGSAAYLFELVFEPAADHLELASRHGKSVLLKRRESSPYSADRLESSLRYHGLSRATVDQNLIVAELADDTAAQGFSLKAAGIAVGPYKAVDVAGALRLEPRNIEDNPTRLEIVSAERDEHWRLLAGQHVDVAPQIRASHARFLSDVPSVQLIRYSVRGRVALLANQHDSVLASAEVRRGLASAVDATATARVVCGNQNCDVEGSHAPEPADELAPLPRALSLVAVDGSKDEELTAKVVAHHLWEVHRIRVTVEYLSVRDLSQRLLSRNYELIVLPVPTDSRHLFEAFAGILDEGSDRLESALEREAWDRAVDILIDDAILIPLWSEQFYAAIDSSVCGARPDSATSWLWLADLHFCEDEAD
jgi:hypothetical protein